MVILSVLVAAGCLTNVFAPMAAAAPASSPTTVLYAWGDNTFGQLGNGSTISSSVPVPVTLPDGATPVAVSEGYFTSLALGSNGTVYAWGNNAFGQLGNGTDTGPSTCQGLACSLAPTAVPLPGGVRATAVSEGLYTSLALGANGTVYAWGSNQAGQLGNGAATGPEICDDSFSTPCSTTPMAVSLPGGLAATAVSESGLYTSYALAAGGGIFAWGNNTDGQLGIGSSTGPATCGGPPCSTTPIAVPLPGGVTATAVSAGGAAALALGSDGNIYAWGDNGAGQLGNGSDIGPSTCLGSGCGLTPAAVSLPGGVTATAMSEGPGTSLALGSDGSVYSWGSNNTGQLGNGTLTNSPAPVRVSLPGATAAMGVSAGASNAQAITPDGYGASLALGSNGSVYSWGASSAGPGSATPMQVPLPDGAVPTAVSQGSGTSLAIATLGGPVPTMTSLTASPDPAVAGAAVTLTATEVAGDNTSPAGSVLFEIGGTAIGSPVPVNPRGVAAITTTFAGAGVDALSAVFTPADLTSFNVSASTLSLPVKPAPPHTIPLAVTVPQSGAFTLTVDTTDTVTLAVSGSSATAATTQITVSDTRNTFPGWSVHGQATDWTGSGAAAGATISGNQLGWMPTSTGTLPQGVILGSPVTPASPGLGSTPAELASAPPGAGNGYGTSEFGADLTLVIPQTPTPAAAGSYTTALTISAVESGL